MSDDPTATAPVTALGRLADEVLPALVARLEASRLGELEVRHDGWRVRLRRAPAAHTPVAPQPEARAAATPVREADLGPRHATSPGVGYFAPAEKAPIGKAVKAGDPVGWVEVLGVRQEVIAPHDGTVARHLAEPGQAVEYGQDLVAVEPPHAAAGEPA
jgi:hypothetical protein